jgi:ABC-type amino acid transport substrate-binding protein
VQEIQADGTYSAILEKYNVPGLALDTPEIVTE